MWVWTAVYSKWVCTADVSVQQCTVNVIVSSKCESVSSGVQQLCCHPHSPFLLRWHLSLVGAVTSIIFVATKVLSSQNMSFRHNKTFVAKTLFCHNKTFVVTNICSEKQFCCNTFCYDKSMLVRTKLLLRQNSLLLQIFVATRVISVMTKDVFCHDTTVCHDKHVFVMTKVLLWQNWYLWHLPPGIHISSQEMFTLTKNANISIPQHLQLNGLNGSLGGIKCSCAF